METKSIEPTGSRCPRIQPSPGIFDEVRDAHNSRPIGARTQRARKAIALELLKDGMQATALGLNVMIGANDARRWMTEVRRRTNDYIVRTCRLRDRRVVYRLEPVRADRHLFSGEEAAGRE